MCIRDSLWSLLSQKRNVFVYYRPQTAVSYAGHNQAYANIRGLETLGEWPQNGLDHSHLFFINLSSVMLCLVLVRERERKVEEMGAISDISLNYCDFLIESFKLGIILIFTTLSKNSSIYDSILRIWKFFHIGRNIFSNFHSFQRFEEFLTQKCFESRESLV